MSVGALCGASLHHVHTPGGTISAKPPAAFETASFFAVVVCGRFGKKYAKSVAPRARNPHAGQELQK